MRVRVRVRVRVRELEQLAAREREQHPKWRAAEQRGARASEG